MRANLNVSFRAGEALSAALLERGDNEHQVARRDLGRYYQVLGLELSQLQALAPSEARLLAQAVRLLPAELQDLCELQRVLAWQVQELEGWRSPLVAVVRSLCPGRVAAVLDAVERADRVLEQGGTQDETEVLRAVGLVQIDQAREV